MPCWRWEFWDILKGNWFWIKDRPLSISSLTINICAIYLKLKKLLITYRSHSHKCYSEQLSVIHVRLLLHSNISSCDLSVKQGMLLYVQYLRCLVWGVWWHLRINQYLKEKSVSELCFVLCFWWMHEYCVMGVKCKRLISHCTLLSEAT